MVDPAVRVDDGDVPQFCVGCSAQAASAAKWSRSSRTWGEPGEPVLLPHLSGGLPQACQHRKLRPYVSLVALLKCPFSVSGDLEKKHQFWHLHSCICVFIAKICTTCWQNSPIHTLPIIFLKNNYVMPLFKDENCSLCALCMFLCQSWVIKMMRVFICLCITIL